MATTILGLIGFLFQLPYRMGAKLLGINDRPNIEFGELAANVTDARQPYKTWFHLECENKKVGGLRGKLAPTRDAHNCRVNLELTPSFGDHPSIADEGIFVLGATSQQYATLFAGKKAFIPISWTALTNSASTPHGRTVTRGYYLTGAEWILHRDLSHKWTIPPGIYILTVVVTWEGKSYPPYCTELSIPDQAEKS